MEKPQYLYPVEELDKMIMQLDEGIELFLPDQMVLEIELRRKELENKLFADEDEEEDDDTAYKRILHQEAIRKHLQEQSKKARDTDVMYIELSEEQKQKIRESMETSYVRPDPNTSYNMSDDDIREDATKKVLMSKLSKLRVAYYNQTDYQNAINIILEAINYSLENEYPWMSKEEAIRAFNEGKIKFTFCQIPKLFLNYKTQVTDPNILKGVATGDVELVSKSERDFARKSYKHSPLVSMPVSIISEDEHKYYMDAHRKGAFTPISPTIAQHNTIYDRFQVKIGGTDSRKTSVTGFTDKLGNPIGFDWTQDNAHEKYAMERAGKKFGIDEIMEFVNQTNTGIKSHVVSNMNAHLLAYNSTTLSVDENDKYSIVSDGYRQQNAEIIKTEQSILARIQSNNILK